MHSFVAAARTAVNNKNWYAALSVALLLPDICGRIENPKLGSQRRYREWFDAWLGPKYSAGAGDRRRSLLSGGDCYALRCALTHEGRDNISEQGAQEVLSSFRFNTPYALINMHRNQLNGVLQLQVDIFALDICAAVEEWLKSMENNEEVQKRLGELIAIHKTEDGIPGFLRFD